MYHKIIIKYTTTYNSEIKTNSEQLIIIRDGERKFNVLKIPLLLTQLCKPQGLNIIHLFCL